MKLTKNKLSVIHIARRVIQLLAFLFFPGIFTTVFYAIKTVYINILQHNVSMATTGYTALMLVGVFLITIVFGRFFCGYLCSFGAMEDLLWFLSKHTLKLKKKMPQKIDAKLKYVKYGVLLLIVVVFWTLQYQLAGSVMSPWVIFGMYTRISGWKNPQMLISIGGALLLAIMVISFFIERFFCRYLCPLGAIFAWMSRIRPYSLKKERSECGACRACTNKCPMGIPLYEMDKVTTGECIECFSCMEICPRENIIANPAPVVATAVSAAAITGVVYLGTLPQLQKTDTGSVVVDENHDSADINNTDDMQLEDVTGSDATGNDTEISGQYTDGTYSGTGMGFRGETEVSVEVKNGKIADITVVSYVDDEQFFSRAKDTVISEIIEAQSVDVASVSGATFSSNGIKEAVAKALSWDYENTNESQSGHGNGHYDGGNRGGDGEGFHKGKRDGSGENGNHENRHNSDESWSDKGNIL